MDFFEALKEDAGVSKRFNEYASVMDVLFAQLFRNFTSEADNLIISSFLRFAEEEHFDITREEIIKKLTSGSKQSECRVSEYTAKQFHAALERLSKPYDPDFDPHADPELDYIR